MFEYSRHLSGLPIPESSKPKIPSGTPGFDGDAFLGYSFFRNSSWNILNSTPKEPGWGLEAHWAFSLGKRAMGFPTQSKRVSSIKKFWKRTRQLRDPPEEVLQEAREFGYQYGYQFPAVRIKMNLFVHISHSKSSCMEVSKLKGGRLRFGQLRLEEFDECYWMVPKGRTIFGPSGEVLIDILNEEAILMCLKDAGDEWVVLGPQVRFLLGDQRILRELAFAECSSNDEIPFDLVTTPIASYDCDSFEFHLFDESPRYVAPEADEAEVQMRLDAVDDDGAKARIIGISNGALVNLLHILRTLITSVIKCDREVPTMGGKSRRPDRTLSSEGLFDSADLTAATDCSSIREVSCLLEGLCSALIERELVPKWLEGNLLTLCSLAMRPQEVHAPKWWNDEPIFPFSTLRSVPMGQPHSWVLLCLGQLFHRKRTREMVKSTLPDIRKWKLTVCGDDTCSSGNSRESCFMFRISLRNSGYELSSGTDIISELAAQYTEQLYVKDIGGTGNLRQVLFPFVKTLTFKSPPGRLPQKRGRAEKTSHTSRGTAMTLSTNSISLPFSTEDFVELVRKVSRLYSLYSNHLILDRARNLDLPPYIPVEFGGLGFSHPTDRGFAHTRPFYLKGIWSLLSENRNIDYILNFRTLGSVWVYSPKDETVVETNRLMDHWIQSVFADHRKVRGEHDLELASDPFDGNRPVWVDVQEASQIFDIPLEVGDWKSYDKLKESLGLSTKVQWFPIKEVLDHVEAGFRNEVLFRTDQGNQVEIPSLPSISKRIHSFYKKRMESYPPTSRWRTLKDRTVSETLDILHWRQNLVLVSGSLPRLENFSSRWG
jgi:hypothetical protein